MPLDDEQIARLRAYVEQLQELVSRQQAYIADLEAEVGRLKHATEGMRLDTLR